MFEDFVSVVFVKDLFIVPNSKLEDELIEIIKLIGLLTLCTPGLFRSIERVTDSDPSVLIRLP